MKRLFSGLLQRLLVTITLKKMQTEFMDVYCFSHTWGGLLELAAYLVRLLIYALLLKVNLLTGVFNSLFSKLCICDQVAFLSVIRAHIIHL